MAGLINWKKVAIPGSSPDANHLYVGVDPADCKLYIKDDAGAVSKYETSANVAASIAAALADYDLSTVVDSKISAAISALIDGAPATLDTLNELAAALADDANFASTVTTALAGKQPLDGDLTAVAALAGAGFAVRTTTNTWATRSLTTPVGSGLAITNQDGVFGSPAFTNTDKGSTAVTTHEAAVDPHPQYETSAEAQAKVDAHANLTNNPHATTKAQVGLGNVDNTSDLNKPISTATQTALNLKYDASNPNGYETPTQLNTRDTNNRDRANHTGMQLASTVSDFANTVRSTVLTGLTLATNAVISASDTVLSALGKLQAQLTQAISDVNATFALVTGRLDVLEATDAEWIELIKTSADLLNSSNVTLTNVTDLQFTATAGRTYYLEYTIIFRAAATTTGLAITIGTSSGAAGTLAAQVNIPIAADGTAALFTGNITSLGDIVTATGVQTAVTNNIATMRGIFICTTGGVIVPQFRSEVNGSNAAVAIGSVALVRIF